MRVFLINITYYLGEFFFKIFRFRKKACLNRGRKYNEILIMRLDSIGDFILSVPFIRAIRMHYPDSRITLIVKSCSYDLAELCPYVDNVLSFDTVIGGRFNLSARRSRSLRFIIMAARSLMFARSELWKHKYDLAVLPRWDTDHYYASILMFLSGAGERIGYSEYVNPVKKEKNRGYDKLFTKVLNIENVEHEVERNLNILGLLNIEAGTKYLELWLSEKDKKYSEKILSKMHGHDVIVCVGAGAKEPKRRWPADKYIQLLKWLVEEYSVLIVLLGDRSDISVNTGINEGLAGTNASDIIDLTGRTTIREAAAVLSTSYMYIGNDTGIIHIASALKIPVVEISCWLENGSINSENSPVRFGPWQVNNMVVTPAEPVKPCIDECTSSETHCIDGVSVRQVAAAVNEIFKDENGRK